MKKKPSDRHLDVPAEANRDKHINFLALENNDKDPADIPAKKKLSERKSSNKKNGETDRTNKD